MEKSRIPLFGILGIGTTFIGIVLGWYGFPKIVKWQIDTKIALNNGSEMYPMWVKLPMPLSFNAYFLSVLNPDEVSNGANPIVKEMGPYCYDEFLEKVVLKVDDEQDTITYALKRLIYKAHRPGCASDEDMVTTINVGLLGTVKIVNGLFPDLLSTFNDAIPLLFPGIKSIFTTAKVKDLLFDGIVLDCSADDFTLEMVCKNIKSQAPPMVRRHANGRDYEFSMFSYINGTDQGTYTVYRGNKDINMLGYMTEWNGKSETDMWEGDCKKIRGTDSTIFPPLNNNSKIFTFQPDVCRTLYVEYQNHSEVNGIPTIRYSVSKDLFAASKENECFCMKQKDEETGVESLNCLKDGTLQLDTCLGAPVIATWPHFLLADEEYSKYVSGLTPDPERHLTVAEIEPMLGVPIKGYKRVQLNMMMEQMEDITVLETVSEGLFPILWIEEGAELPPSLFSLVSMVYNILKALSVLKWLMVFGGLGLVGLAVYLYSKSNKILCFNQQAKIADVNFDPKYDSGHGYVNGDFQRDSITLGSNLSQGFSRFDNFSGTDNPQIINKFNINNLRSEFAHHKPNRDFNSFNSNGHQFSSIQF